MDIVEFFEATLPRRGVLQLAVLRDGKLKHIAFDDFQEMARRAVFEDSVGNTVYHACASYLDKGSRTQTNALAMRALWVDIDVGKANDRNSYDSRKEALAEIKSAVRQLGLKPPMLVSSGSGFHL